MSFRSVIVFVAGCTLFGVSAADLCAASSKRVVVDYWEKWGGFEADAMQTIINDFNRSQDRIEVRFLSISPIDVKL